MNKKPPYYELDHDTRRIAEVVTELAEDLASIQGCKTAKDNMLRLTQELALRLGLNVQPPEPKPEGTVVPFKPKSFRIVSSELKKD